MARKCLLITTFFLLLTVPQTIWAQSPPASDEEKIEDNSFLIEEAYNQEEGVVQNINLFTFSRGGNLVYTNTEEVPLWHPKHQLSYTFTAQSIDDENGLGDFAINYRYQLLQKERIAIAPRITFLLPTGDSKRGLGMGGSSYQFGLPISIKLSKQFVTHSNAGFTYTPNAKSPAGVKGIARTYNIGQSLVWLTKPRFNLLVETVYSSAQSITDDGKIDHNDSLFINPGMRFAFNFKSGLQIVPGVGVPIGVGPSKDDYAVIFYLSFEHPLKLFSRK